MTQLQTLQREETVFPYSKWYAQLDSLRRRYEEAYPFPHIVLDDFLQTGALEKALAEFPGLESKDWIHYIHFNERKLGKKDMESFPPVIQNIFRTLNSKIFTQFLTDLTGIEALIADDKFEGGGLHQSGPGGFLNIHADFTAHPHQRHWRRRINVLVYLNKHWQDSYHGHLELWDKKMKHCLHKIAPVFNRCVIFNTDADAFHGHPDPLSCPQGMSRKSFALYYFTKEDAPLVRSTEYKARPGDGWKSFLIFADKMVLRAYDRFKRITKIDDGFVSGLLRSLDRWKRRQR